MRVRAPSVNLARSLSVFSKVLGANPVLPDPGLAQQHLTKVPHTAIPSLKSIQAESAEVQPTTRI